MEPWPFSIPKMCIHSFYSLVDIDLGACHFSLNAHTYRIQSATLASELHPISSPMISILDRGGSLSLSTKTATESPASGNCAILLPSFVMSSKA